MLIVAQEQGRVNRPQVEVESQGHVFKVRITGGQQKGGGVRGHVNGFSAASRKRLIELLARLNIHPVKRSGFRSVVATFLTLTFPGCPTPGDAKRLLQTFFKRLRRKFPDVSAVWRMEFQKRGSPHFHILFFNLPYWNKKEVQRVWGEVIGCESPFTRIEAVRSWRGVLAYAAKYMSKPADGGAASGLDNDTYLTGRVWGVFNREALPQGELIKEVFNLAPWVYRLRRLARRGAWRGVSKRRGGGFTLFVNDTSQWFMLAAVLESGAL